jgi:hypothetical protein
LSEPRTATDVYTREELENLFPISDREEQLNPQFRLDSAACLGITAGGGAGAAGGGGGGGLPASPF